MRSFNKPLAAISIAALLAMSSQANAGLIMRTDNLIYDDINDLTWLVDANQSQTSGYDADGKMSWADATAWADQLTITGFSDWSLPTLSEGLVLVAQDLASFDVSDIGGSQFWTSTENPKNSAKAFWFRLDGSSGNVFKTSANKFSWAVTAGDIAGNKVDATVSEPATVAIFSLALAGLAYRRKKSSSVTK